MKRGIYKKRTKYSVPDSVLDQLVDLLRSWGITEKDWLLTTEHALQRFGYPLVDPYSPHEVDVVIRRSAIPWRVKDNEWTILPPQKSKYFKDFRRFSTTTHFVLHFAMSPYGPLRVREIDSASWYALPTGRRIHVATPVQYVDAMTALTQAPAIASHMRENIPRMKKRFEELYRYAIREGDQPLIKACRAFFKVAGKDRHIMSSYTASENLLQGVGIGKGRLKGMTHIVRGEKEFSNFRRGEILVSADTNPVYLPLMKKARAIVTDRGGLTSHAATLAREFGIPAVIGTKVATKVLKTGDRVEVDMGNGIVRKLKK
jgi:phosphohistidine swiveling domain-containing protein